MSAVSQHVLRGEPRPACGSLWRRRSGHFFSLAAEGHRGHNGIVINLALRLYVLNWHRLYFEHGRMSTESPIPSSLPRARLLHEVALTVGQQLRVSPFVRSTNLPCRRVRRPRGAKTHHQQYGFQLARGFAISMPAPRRWWKA